MLKNKKLGPTFKKMSTNASGYLISSNDLYYLVVMLSVVSKLVSLREASMYVGGLGNKYCCVRTYV